MGMIDMEQQIEIPEDIMNEDLAISIEEILETVKKGDVQKENIPAVRKMLYDSRSRFEDAVESFNKLITKVDLIDKELSKWEI